MVEPEKPIIETGWIIIPAGEFTLGESADIETVDYEYQIMKFEVTNLEYIEYLNANYNKGTINLKDDGIYGFYGDENIEHKSYRFYNFENYLQFPNRYFFGKIYFEKNEFKVNSGFENHPVVLVTYYGAAAFAEYYGLRLPTEFEWEKAARGNTGWNYSFGDTISVYRANYLSGGEYSLSDPFESGTTPVGFYNGEIHSNFFTINSPSPFGLYDMTGNVHEWTDSYSTYPGFFRIIRSGSWYFGNSVWLNVWFRHNHSPGFSCEYIGFRCVKR